MTDPRFTSAQAGGRTMQKHTGSTAARSFRRPLRAVPLTRRYGAAARLSAEDSGEHTRTARLAPALPAFEQAFSAFARGTPLATPGGPVSVEDLMPGDRVLTQESGAQPIAWIGTMTLYPAHIPGAPPSPGPIRVVADAFGPGRPAHDLVLGPSARLLQPARSGAALGQDVLMPVAELIDGMSAIRLSPVAPLEVFHVALDRHATLRAAGLALESYHPGATIESMTPEMAQLFLALFPHLSRLSEFGPMAHPQVPMTEAQPHRAA